METIKVSTSQHVDIDYPVAGLGERIAARLIDLGVFLGLFFLFLIVGALLSVSHNKTAILVEMIIFAVGYVFYNLLCEIFMNGQCIGKRSMKIKVISLDGSPATIGQYFIRWLFRLVDFVLTFQVGGMICMVLSENKQRIGDIVAGTAVIKTVPRTDFGHIVFIPAEEGYTPVFTQVSQLNDGDIELIHEVITVYHQTGSAELLYTMSVKIASTLAVRPPEEEQRLDFLSTVIKDYNHVTSAAD